MLLHNTIDKDEDDVRLHAYRFPRGVLAAGGAGRPPPWERLLHGEPRLPTTKWLCRSPTTDGAGERETFRGKRGVWRAVSGAVLGNGKGNGCNRVFLSFVHLLWLFVGLMRCPWPGTR